MVGWHHRLNRHDFAQAPGDGEGQGKVACGSPWGPKELDTTEQLISEVIDIFPGNLDSSLCFVQCSVSHDVLCM